MIYMLHISDLHFVKNAQADIFEKILMEEASKKVEGVCQGQKLLIVTGDLHNFSDNNYEAASSFLSRLVDSMGLNMTSDVFVVPGNHDVGNETALESLLKDKDPDWKNHLKSSAYMLRKGDYSYTQERLRAFRTYSAFVCGLGIYDAAKELDWPATTHMRTWEGTQRLNILHLNTALIADGKEKANQMTDTNTAASLVNSWASTSEAIPAIAIGHNNFFDLQQKQRDELASIFSLGNICIYLCGDRHQYERNAEEQEIRLESGYGKGKRIYNLAAAKAIADRNDDFSEFGFSWHIWNEVTGEVTVELRKWRSDLRSSTIQDGETFTYYLYDKDTHDYGNIMVDPDFEQYITTFA